MVWPVIRLMYGGDDSIERVWKKCSVYEWDDGCHAWMMNWETIYEFQLLWSYRFPWIRKDLLKERHSKFMSMGATCYDNLSSSSSRLWAYLSKYLLKIANVAV